MMELQKKPSRGMRKHIRQQKAQERKAKDRQPKLSNLEAALPSFESFPRRYDGGYGWKCPHCKTVLLHWEVTGKTIQTQEGPRELFLHVTCQKMHRL